jgi:hypothetical protein
VYWVEITPDVKTGGLAKTTPLRVTFPVVIVLETKVGGREKTTPARV